MSTGSVASKITEESFAFFQSASDGTTLAHHAGQVVNAESPATEAQYKELAADVVSTVDALINPIIELANLDSPVTNKVIQNGGRLLGGGSLARGCYEPATRVATCFVMSVAKATRCRPASVWAYRS